MKKRVLKRAGSTALGALMFICLPLSTFARTMDVSSYGGLVSIDLADETEDLILTGTVSYAAYVRLIADSGKKKTVILQNVNIDKTDIFGDQVAAISLAGTGDVIIELDGSNVLKSGVGHSGLEKESGVYLTIKDDNGTPGSLEAIGGENGAGIGGAGNNITIKGGTITATGGDNGAGIGGGNGSGGNNITIKGGTVTATGGYNGAGIGGGSGGAGTEIVIEDGTITATGGYDGAGIGGGNGGAGTEIVIEDGTITAIGGDNGAGIGGGTLGAGEVTIKGGTVTATGGFGASGIGAGCMNVGEVTINGGTVTATGGLGGAGIGGGVNMDQADEVSGIVTINDGTVTATGGDFGGAGIGGGTGRGGKVTIGGGSVNATGGNYGAGIGGGSKGTGEVTITGGYVTATGGLIGAGIGGGAGSTGSSLTVSSDTTIYAVGGNSNASYGEGAAIGEGGANSNIGDSSNGEPINGADVTPVTTDLYTTGSITTFEAGTTLDEIEQGTVSGVTVFGTKAAPEPETTNEETQKDNTSKEDPKKEQPAKKPAPVYTERSCIADVDVAALVATALKADPNAKEVNIEFGDNICLTPDIMKDLFADNRVAKNCMFSHKGKRYVLRINAVDTKSKAYADGFAALKEEPDGLAGFLQMAKLFEALGVKATELDQ